MTDTALKPCPFCDGEGFLAQSPILDRTWRVSCRSCFAASSPATAREGAIEKWNTRIALSAHPRPVETVQADAQPVAVPNLITAMIARLREFAKATVDPIEDETGNRLTYEDSLIWVAADMLSSCQATVAALEAERDAARDALNHVFQQKDELLKDLNQTTIRAETAEADLKHLRSMAGKSRGELEAFLAEMQKRPPLCDDEGCPHHGTVHICSDIETQRLQRLMSSSEAERYRSCGELLTSLTACQREKEGLLEELIAARKFIKSVAPLITETAHYQYDIPTQKVIEDALNSEGA